MIKRIITDFRRFSVYGDLELTTDGYFISLIGSRIEVKLFGLFWIKYRNFKIK